MGGTVGLDEYRQDVITRGAFLDIAEIDDAFNKLVSEADKAAGGITLARYEELYEVTFIYFNINEWKTGKSFYTKNCPQLLMDVVWNVIQKVQCPLVLILC